jgi:hypothetical protein
MLINYRERKRIEEGPALARTLVRSTERELVICVTLDEYNRVSSINFSPDHLRRLSELKVDTDIDVV